MSSIFNTPNRKWFTLKLPTYRWWHWITKPIQTYVMWKYLKTIHEVVDKHIDKDAWNRCYSDSLMYGRGIFQMEKRDKDE